MPDRTVVITAKAEESEDDPVVAAFLAFLEKDMLENPRRLQPLTRELFDEVNELVADGDVDLDAPIVDD